MADAAYYREWRKKNPDKVKARSKINAQKQKEARQAEIVTRPRCAVCGQPFVKRALNSPVTAMAGVHQKCDPAAWMAAHRSLYGRGDRK